MENFPVEVIGKILSQVAVAEQVVRASGTCRKWRQAARNHLHTLRYDCGNRSRVYRNVQLADLEVFLTQTILQTSSLKELCILTEQGFSAAVLIAWLFHVRSSLRILSYGLMMWNPNWPHRLHASVLETCGKMNCLEILELSRIRVTDVDFTLQSWPSLVSLLLREVSISVSDLNSILLACPKLESLTLENPTIVPRATLSLTSSALKAFQLESTTTRSVDNILLEAEALESLDLLCCNLQHFSLLNGNLHRLRIKDSHFDQLDIAPDTGQLEVLHVRNAEIPWPGFGDFLSKIPNLKELQLWGIKSGGYLDVMDFEAIGRSFPNLNHLAMTLDYEVMKGNIDNLLFSKRTSPLEKLVFLELESTTILNDMFCRWIEVFLQICPSLKQLVVWSNTQQAQGARQRADPSSIGGFINSFVKLARKRKFSEVDMQYQDIKGSK